MATLKRFGYANREISHYVRGNVRDFMTIDNHFNETAALLLNVDAYTASAPDMTVNDFDVEEHERQAILLQIDDVSRTGFMELYRIGRALLRGRTVQLNSGETLSIPALQGRA